MSALWNGFCLGVLVFFFVGFFSLAAAVVKAGQRGDEEAALLWAIAEKETGHNAGLIGRRGEITAYQFMPETWREYTDLAPREAVHNPWLAHAVAEAHLDWISRQLRRGGLKPTPYRIALAWNAGVAAVLAGRVPESSKAYAQCVVNLYAGAAQ